MSKQIRLREEATKYGSVEIRCIVASENKHSSYRLMSIILKDSQDIMLFEIHKSQPTYLDVVNDKQ